MNHIGFGKKGIRITLYLIATILISGLNPALSKELPQHIEQAIKNKFPSAIISEVRQERWNGEMVFEVELETHNDKEYEVIISRDDTILDVKKKKACPGLVKNYPWVPA